LIPHTFVIALTHFSSMNVIFLLFFLSYFFLPLFLIHSIFHDSLFLFSLSSCFLLVVSLYLPIFSSLFRTYSLVSFYNIPFTIFFSFLYAFLVLCLSPNFYITLLTFLLSFFLSSYLISTRLFSPRVNLMPSNLCHFCHPWLIPRGPSGPSYTPYSPSIHPAYLYPVICVQRLYSKRNVR
jgi:hypothetical protein